MRIKKDHTGWRSSGLWKKYSLPSIDELTPRPKSKKNTAKWCKGRVGLKHDYKLDFPRNKSHFSRERYKLPICQKCGKHDHKGILYKNEKTGCYEPFDFNSIF